MRSLKTKNQKVLVTGSFGYLGSLIVQELKTDEVDYLAVDKVASDDSRHLCFDLKDKKQTMECIERFKPNYLIHCATHSALAYQHDFLNSFREDSLVLYNILEALRKTQECRMIYFSSSYVYSGLSLDSKVTEESFLKPTHNFGVAKVFFEQFLLKNKPDSILFRLFSVFGPGNYLFPNSVHKMVQECKEKGEIQVWGNGTRKIQYVFTGDVLCYIEQGFSLAPGIYNLGGNEYLAVTEVAQSIAKLFGAKVEFVKEKKEGETLPFGDNAKMKRLCGKDLFTPFATAIKEYQQ